MEKTEIDPLKCQVAGCYARWTVDMGWRKCAKHAWTDDKSEPVMKPLVLDRPPVRPFTEVDDHEIF